MTSPAAPPINGQSSFTWSYQPGSGSETGGTAAQVLTFPNYATYAVTCQAAKGTSPWFVPGEVSDSLDVTLSEGSGPVAGPAVQPAVVAVGQKATLTGQATYTAAPTQGYIWAPAADATSVATATTVPSAVAAPVAADATELPSADAAAGAVPVNGQITTEVWPTADSWYALAAGDLDAEASAEPSGSPYPNVQVAQLWAIDAVSSSSPVPTASAVDIKAKVGSSVQVEATWGISDPEATASYSAAPAIPETELSLFDGEQQIQVGVELETTYNLPNDQTQPASIGISYPADKPSNGASVLLEPADGAFGVYPYTGTKQQELINALIPAASKAAFNITPVYLVSETNDQQDATVSVDGDGNAIKVFEALDLEVVYNDKVNYPDADADLDGSVAWEVVSGPSASGRAAADDQSMLSAAETAFEAGADPSTDPATSSVSFTPQALGRYVITATGQPSGGTVTFNVDVSALATPNQVVTKPAGTLTLAVGESADVDALAVNELGSGYTDEPPAGTWTLADDQGVPLKNNQLTLEGADTASVTVTPGPNALGQTWQLIFTPADASAVAPAPVLINVIPPKPTVEVTATPQEDNPDVYDLAVTTDPADLEGTWSIAPAEGENAPTGSIVPQILTSTNPVTLNADGASPGDWVVTYTTKAVPQKYSSATGETTITVEPKAPVQVQVTWEQAEGGTIAVSDASGSIAESPASVDKGTALTITVTPDEGKIVSTVTANDTPLALPADYAGGPVTLEYTADADVTLNATFDALPVGEGATAALSNNVVWTKFGSAGLSQVTSAQLPIITGWTGETAPTYTVQVNDAPYEGTLPAYTEEDGSWSAEPLKDLATLNSLSVTLTKADAASYASGTIGEETVAAVDGSLTFTYDVKRMQLTLNLGLGLPEAPSARQARDAGASDEIDLNATAFIGTGKAFTITTSGASVPQDGRYVILPLGETPTAESESVEGASVTNVDGTFTISMPAQSTPGLTQYMIAWITPDGEVVPDVQPLNVVTMSLTLDPPSAILAPEGSQEITATVDTGDFTYPGDPVISWAVADDAEAAGTAVSPETGESTTVTAGSTEGKATVTATLAGTPGLDADFTADCMVDVTTKLTISVTPRTLSLSLPDKAEGQLTATTNAGDDSAITWTSDDPTVATVDETGKVTALKAGSTTVTATVTAGEESATSDPVTVEVTDSTPPPAEDLPTFDVTPADIAAQPTEEKPELALTLPSDLSEDVTITPAEGVKGSWSDLPEDVEPAEDGSITLSPEQLAQIADGTLAQPVFTTSAGTEVPVTVTKEAPPAELPTFDVTPEGIATQPTEEKPELALALPSDLSEDVTITPAEGVEGSWSDLPEDVEPAEDGSITLSPEQLAQIADGTLVQPVFATSDGTKVPITVTKEAPPAELPSFDVTPEGVAAQPTEENPELALTLPSDFSDDVTITPAEGVEGSWTTLPEDVEPAEDGSITLTPEQLAQIEDGTLAAPVFTTSDGTEIPVTVSTEKPVDKTDLDKALEQAGSILPDVLAVPAGTDPAKMPVGRPFMTAKELADLRTAAAAAEQISKNPDATAAEVADALKALQDALGAVQYGTSPLTVGIASGSGLLENAYDGEWNWNPFTYWTQPKRGLFADAESQVMASYPQAEVPVQPASPSGSLKDHFQIGPNNVAVCPNYEATPGADLTLNDRIQIYYSPSNIAVPVVQLDDAGDPIVDAAGNPVTAIEWLNNCNWQDYVTLEWEYKPSTKDEDDGNPLKIPAGFGFSGIRSPLLTISPLTEYMDGWWVRLAVYPKADLNLDLEEGDDLYWTTRWIRLDIDGVNGALDPEITISSNPEAVGSITNVSRGGDAVFTANVSNQPYGSTLDYQWQSLAQPTAANPTPAWADVAGATGQSLTVPNVTDAMSGISYRCTVTCVQSGPGGLGTINVSTNYLTLNVTPPDGSVYIPSANPDGSRLIWKLVGDTLQAQVTAKTDNGDPVKYQWYVRSYLAPVPASVDTVAEAAAYLAGAASEAVPSATGANLVSEPLQEGVYAFRCRVENANNVAKAAFSPIIYVVVTKNQFEIYPAPGDIISAGVVNGHALTLKAWARAANATYTWQRYNTASGKWTTLTATGQNLVLPSLTTEATGTLYRCAISTPGGSDPIYTGWYLVNVWDTANTPVVTSTAQNLRWTLAEFKNDYDKLTAGDTMKLLTSNASVAQDLNHGIGPVVAVWYSNTGSVVARNTYGSLVSPALDLNLPAVAEDSILTSTVTQTATGSYESTLSLDFDKVTRKVADDEDKCASASTVARALNGTYYCVWYKPQTVQEYCCQTEYTYDYETRYHASQSVTPVNVAAGMELLAPQAVKGWTAIQIQIPGDPWIITDLDETRTVSIGSQATLSVAAAITQPSDTTAPVYTWQVTEDGGKNWRNCLSTDGTGQFTSTFTTRTITQDDYDTNLTLTYRVIVASRPNVAKIVSNECALQITAGTPEAPVITPGPGSPITVENGQAIGITVSKDGTTVGEFLSQLNMTPVPGYSLRIAGSDGQLPDADGIVYTGCVLELVEDATGSVVDMATIIVMGDVLGNGIIGINQVVRMAQDLNGSRPLEGIYAQAGDFNGSGSIDIADLVREAQILSEPIDVQK